MAASSPIIRPTRRHLLSAGSATLALWALAPRLASAAGVRSPRFLCIVLHGGLDGLSMVAPVGDPDYEHRRGLLAIPRAGEGAGPPLDNMFVLNPNMPVVHDLYRRREALLVHAVATPSRNRSHFDAQDVLESGMSSGRMDTGWLNRAVSVMPSRGKAAPAKGLAIGEVVPLIMRGEAPVMSWSAVAAGREQSGSTAERLGALYAAADPVMARSLAEGLEVERIAATAAPAARPTSAAEVVPPRHHPFVYAAKSAAMFLKQADGPHIGALAYNGWDTHANEGVLKGVLAQQLNGLDQAIGALAAGLGSHWRDTVVAVVTEFGRTARANGTLGTDHGTATAVLLVGGAVNGGRVVADWPGLSDKALFQGRDLAPTLDLRSVLGGVLRDHLGLPTAVLSRTVFPESQGVAPLDGLIINI